MDSTAWGTGVWAEGAWEDGVWTQEEGGGASNDYVTVFFRQLDTVRRRRR